MSSAWRPWRIFRWHLLGGYWIVLLGQVAAAADWPQWQGPTRNSVWPETGIVEQFPEQGPAVRWRVKIAGGYSGPAVAQGRVFVTDFLKSSGEVQNDPNARVRLEGLERIWCLDVQTGEVHWKHDYPRVYEISYPVGPRATPTVDGERVYTLGPEGDLLCLATADGQVIWRKNFREDLQAPTPIWGHSAHPLVLGDLLICMVGGPGQTVMAFDKQTGAERWRALSASDAGYSPPTLIEEGGTQQLMVWHPQAVQGLHPRTGELFWTVPLEPDYGMSINPAIHASPYLFVGGIVNKAVLLRLANEQPQVAEEVWRASPTRGIAPVFAPPFIDGDVLYGVDRGGEMSGVELKTGKKLWETYAPTTGTRRANSATAFLVKNGSRYFLMSETGDLIIARLTPQGYEEVDRTHVLEPTHEAFGRQVLWSHPAFADRCMFARNDREIVCVSLAASP